jgi:hypothetical protein
MKSTSEAKFYTVLTVSKDFGKSINLDEQLVKKIGRRRGDMKKCNVIIMK